MISEDQKKYKVIHNDVVRGDILQLPNISWNVQHSWTCTCHYFARPGKFDIFKCLKSKPPP